MRHFPRYQTRPSARRAEAGNRDYFDDCSWNAVLRAYADHFFYRRSLRPRVAIEPMGRTILLPVQASYIAVAIPYIKVRCANWGLPRNLAVLAPSLAGALGLERPDQTARTCVARDLAKDMGGSSVPLLDQRSPSSPRPPGKSGQANPLALEKAFGTPLETDRAARCPHSGMDSAPRAHSTLRRKFRPFA